MMSQLEPSRESPMYKGRVLPSVILAIMVFGGVLLQGCSTATKDKTVAAVDAPLDAAWPVIFEPGYQTAQLERSSHAQGAISPSAVDGDDNNLVIGAIGFAAGVVSIGKDKASMAKVLALADQIQRYADGASVVIRGYAVNDKGLERATQTAHWRAESLYYGLSRAGIPQASMLIETRVLEANSGAAGRQSVVVKRR